MKAISLWQPWASLIAIGAKRIETRSWHTSYRGPLAILATASTKPNVLRVSWSYPAIRRALINAGIGAAEILPNGVILATCDLVDCLRISDAVSSTETWPPDEPERSFGDYRPGRFAWMLANIKRLQTPIPCKGAQRIFNISDDLLKGAL